MMRTPDLQEYKFILYNLDSDDDELDFLRNDKTDFNLRKQIRKDYKEGVVKKLKQNYDKIYQVE